MELAIDSGVISKPKELVITLAMLFIPLIWSGPQLLIGLVINMLLCISAKTSHPKRWLLMAALPSLAGIIYNVSGLLMANNHCGQLSLYANWDDKISFLGSGGRQNRTALFWGDAIIYI